MRSIFSLAFAGALCLALILMPQGPARADSAVKPKIKEIRVNGGTAVQGAEMTVGDQLFIVLERDSVNALKRRPDDAIRLFLDGKLLRGVSVFPAGNGDPDALRVKLVRTADNRDVWSDLLGLGQNELLPHPRAVFVSVGTDSGLLAESEWQLRIVPMVGHWEPLLLGLLGLIFSVFMLSLSLWSPMLRDTGSGSIRGFKLNHPWRDFGTWSLGRCQMAFWSCISLLAFIYIWAVTGATDTVTSSVLVLMGIGAGTGLGAAVVDDNKRASAGPQAASSPQPSQGLLDDLLTDVHGYSFHRVQLALWTLLLAVLFANSVLRRLAMPDFDNTLLTLMGISSGTYLGLKLPEKQS